MPVMWQFGTILIAIIGVLVTLVTVIITVLKLGRNTVTKGDLNNGIESLRSEMLRMFAKMESNFEQLRSEMDRRFAEAEADRKRIEDTAAADRDKIRAEVCSGFAEAAANREKIRDEGAADRERIRAEARDERNNIHSEINRQNHCENNYGLNRG